MILSIFVLNVSNIVVANAKGFKILRFFENACGLSQVHNCIGIVFLKEIVDLESARVQQFLKKLL